LVRSQGIRLARTGPDGSARVIVSAGELLEDVVSWCGRVRWWRPEECEFGYRTSAFRGNSRQVILALALRLAVADTARVGHEEVARAGRRPTAASAGHRDLRCRPRRARGQRHGGGRHRPGHLGVGSFFANPVLERAALDRLLRLAPGLPRWPYQDSGRWKISAAWLIEAAGFHKGYAVVAHRYHGRVYPGHAVSPFPGTSFPRTGAIQSSSP
jgi:UDP-N-acetylenolpyruvoylglucosamine reductase